MEELTPQEWNLLEKCLTENVTSLEWNHFQELLSRHPTLCDYIKRHDYPLDRIQLTASFQVEEALQKLHERFKQENLL